MNKYNDVMLPNEWFSHSDQFKLFQAHLKYPVYTDGVIKLFGQDGTFDNFAQRNSKCFLPNFGDEVLRHVFDNSKRGDPLYEEDRADLCLLFSPVIKGFNYERSVFGTVLGDGKTVRKGQFDDDFARNAIYAQQVAQLVMQDYSDGSKYEILGTKLNQLQSGNCNVAMYLKFPRGCPFESQVYLQSKSFNTRVRVLPNPIVSRFKQDSHGIKLTFTFLAVTQDLYDRSYGFIRSVVKDELGMFMRYIKTRMERGQLEVYAQRDVYTPDDSVLEGVLAGIEKKKNFKAIFSPSVFLAFSWERIVL